MLRTIGSSDATHSPKIAGTTPMPSRVIASASMASVGIVRADVDDLHDRLGERAASAAGVSQSPSGTPTRIASPPEIATSCMCCCDR